MKSPAGPKTNFLLAGFVYCECGKKMYVYTSTPVYKCKTCKRKIHAEDLDEIFHAQLLATHAIYSILKLFTGFAMAAFMACRLMVANAITIMPRRPMQIPAN